MSYAKETAVERQEADGADSKQRRGRDVLTGEGQGDGEALDLSFVSGISTELIRSPFIGIRRPISWPCCCCCTDEDDDANDASVIKAKDQNLEKSEDRKVAVSVILFSSKGSFHAAHHMKQSKKTKKGSAGDRIQEESEQMIASPATQIGRCCCFKNREPERVRFFAGAKASSNEEVEKDAKSQQLLCLSFQSVMGNEVT